MKNASGVIIYVGKAKNLKNRVSQYFGHRGNHTAKVMAMVNEIEDFDYIITPSEVNALMLENTLIKQHKPYYNILLKDDKQYPFIRISRVDAYPKLELVRKFGHDKSRYYGPYMNGISIKSVMEIVNRTFKLRTCNMNLGKLPVGHRACLNYQIGRCMAPCMGYCTAEEYASAISNAMCFLDGEDGKLLEIIYDRMLTASENEDYDTALRLKQDYELITKLKRKQIAVNPRDYNLDVFAIVEGDYCTSVGALVVRSGRILGGDTFILRDGGLGITTSLQQFITEYYDKNGIQVNDVITNVAPADGALFVDAFTEKLGKKVSFSVPAKGVRKSLVDMAVTNAQDAMKRANDNLGKKEERTVKACEQLCAVLNLKSINRMECYDNSNISGTNAVSSMVVFKHGEPSKRDYRRFSVKTVVGADDFATMREIISRRIGRYREGVDDSFSEHPDLIIIDGGKGQLSAVYGVMQELKFDVPVVGLAKREEEIFLPQDTQPILLEKHSASYHLVQRIRDEAHRFAIEYHRSVRIKKQTESRLLEIEGVGKSTIETLFKHFKGINAIASASLPELLAAGISKNRAQAVFDYFRKNKD